MDCNVRTQNDESNHRGRHCTISYANAKYCIVNAIDHGSHGATLVKRVCSSRPNKMNPLRAMDNESHHARWSYSVPWFIQCCGTLDAYAQRQQMLVWTWHTVIHNHAETTWWQTWMLLTSWIKVNAAWSTTMNWRTICAWTWNIALFYIHASSHTHCHVAVRQLEQQSVTETQRTLMSTRYYAQNVMVTEWTTSHNMCTMIVLVSGKKQVKACTMWWTSCFHAALGTSIVVWLYHWFHNEWRNIVHVGSQWCLGDASLSTCVLFCNEHLSTRTKSCCWQLLEECGSA